MDFPETPVSGELYIWDNCACADEVVILSERKRVEGSTMVESVRRSLHALTLGRDDIAFGSYAILSFC